LEGLGGKLSFYREKAASVLKQKVMNELKELDMDKVQFEVDINRSYDNNNKIQFFANGCDKVEFLISTNPGEPLKPLIKIASGGELSRIMLAIKTVLADSDEVHTLIFDEIDTGVSGRAAQKIAEKLSHIGRKKQVLCITHLAQIASMADYHYLIEKNIHQDAANTTVKLLDEEKRKEELARIIGGAKITDLTLKHAEEMILLADKVKQM
jgi:DNA repair protein RecN (Recombination protein N)